MRNVFRFAACCFVCALLTQLLLLLLFFLLLFVVAGAEDKQTNAPPVGPFVFFFESSLETTPHGHTRDQSRINQSALNKIHTSLDA